MANYNNNNDLDLQSDSETSEDWIRQRQEAARSTYNVGRRAAGATYRAGKKASKLAFNAARKYGGKFFGIGTSLVRRALMALLPFWGVIAWFVVIMVIIVIMLIYIFSGPDMLKGQINKMMDELFTTIGKACTTVLMGDDYAAVGATEGAITDVAKYLNNMGFGLVGYGFIDDTEINMYNEYLRGEREQVESSIIADYLAAENRTYMISQVSVRSIFKGVSDRLAGNENADYSSGMINIADEIDAVTEMEIDGKKIPYDNLEQTIALSKNVEVDRKTKKMTITIVEKPIDGVIRTKSTFVYNLEGWVGRYGKPTEFLLALHLGTMAPKLAQSVAIREEFDAVVNMGIFKSVELCKIKWRGYLIDELEPKMENDIKILWQSMKSVNSANAMVPGYVPYTYDDAKNQVQNSYGVTLDEINQAQAQQAKNTKTTYTPYIESVQKHWYKDLIFEDVKSTTDESSYAKVKVGKTTSSWSLNGKNFEVNIYSSGNLAQVAGPKEGPINEKFDALFEKEKWTIMDGSSTTPIKAYESALQDDASKKKIDLDGMNMQIVVTMLEKAEQKSDDAKFIVRALKDFFSKKGFKFIDSKVLNPAGNEVATESENNNPSLPSGTTTASINSLKNILGGKTAPIISDPKKYTIKTSEIPEGTKVYSIVGGEVIDTSENTMQIKITSPSNLKGKTLIINGAKWDPAIGKNTKVSKGTPIATTSNSDISIKLMDETNALMDVSKL